MSMKIAAGMAALATAALLYAAPAFAAAPAKTVSAVTHSSNHADTTSIAGPCTGTSDNGPTWANDNLSLKLTAVPEATPGLWSVTITANGSFDAFADPTTGACYTGHGGVDGWLQYEVSSPTPPDGKNLPSQVPGSMSQGAILDQFFGGNATIVGGGSYSYTYTQINGSKYTQSG